MPVPLFGAVGVAVTGVRKVVKVAKGRPPVPLPGDKTVRADVPLMRAPPTPTAGNMMMLFIAAAIVLLFLFRR